MHRTQKLRLLLFSLQLGPHSLPAPGLERESESRTPLTHEVSF